MPFLKGTIIYGTLQNLYCIFTRFIATSVLHTARVSSVESTMCGNKQRKMPMINVKFGKK